jgi:hypothetical protein
MKNAKKKGCAGNSASGKKHEMMEGEMPKGIKKMDMAMMKAQKKNK